MPRRLHQANKLNAAKGTGPISRIGKTNASRNALKHGLSGVPVLTPSEQARWNHVREFIRELTDDLNAATSDIDDCSTAQVLLERTIILRHKAQSKPELKASGGTMVHELEKLVRFENRLIKRRNRLLAALDHDEYADADSLFMEGTH